jgi:sarcosine oxidase
VVGWFAAQARQFAPENFPVFILDCPESGYFYGIPEHDGAGFKIGKFHHRQQRVDADSIDRRIAPEDVAVLTAMGRYLARPLGAPLTCKTCMFVNSPDEHFIVDALPEQPNVIVAAGFSGHGYKFCSGIGDILADLALAGHTTHDRALFRLSRLRPAALA